jgi:uncharacterized protein YdeI (YjbR/CyaY-like superfamily)
VRTFASDADWEAWLQEHHATSDGLWVKIAKKGSGITTVAYPEVLDAAICFGWIDGQRRAFDEQYFLQRFTPRRARSRWSQINRDKAEALIAAGRMRPAGLAEVERAKADGRWDAAYDGMATASVPEDLANALEEAGLSDVFARLDSRNRYAILHRLQTAKRPETRARRIANCVGMLAAGETPYP